MYVETLAPHQRVLISEVVARWAAVALSTAPTDRNRAERHIKRLYQMVNLKPPRHIVWCGSPLAAALAASVTAEVAGKTFGGLIGPELQAVIMHISRRPIERQTSSEVRAIMAQQVEQRVRDAFATPIRRLLEQLRRGRWLPIDETPVWKSAYMSMEPVLRPPKWRRIAYKDWSDARRALTRYEDRIFQGQYEADWLSFYDYARLALGFEKETEIMQPLMAIAESASWMIPTREVCWVAERHTTLSLDDEKRLHHESGPALAYPDGLAVYAWHGTLVREEIIRHPEAITVRDINIERNMEMRRVMIERYGQERFIEDTSELIHEDEWGALFRRNRRWQTGIEANIMLKVMNSTVEPDGTRKAYFLRVPPHMATAQQAVAWTFDVSPDDYAPLVET